MDDEQLLRTELEFAVADGLWQQEIMTAYGPDVDEDDLTTHQRRGEMGSDLRAAFEDRKRSLQAFRVARGTAYRRCR